MSAITATSTSPTTCSLSDSGTRVYQWFDDPLPCTFPQPSKCGRPAHWRALTDRKFHHVNNVRCELHGGHLVPLVLVEDYNK